MKKLFILVMALMPLLAISNYPEAKADNPEGSQTNQNVFWHKTWEGHC